MFELALLTIVPFAPLQEPPDPPSPAEQEKPEVVKRGQAIPAMPMVQPMFDPNRTYEARDWVDRVAKTLGPGTVVPFEQRMKLMGMIGGPDAEPEEFHVARKGRLIFGGELGVRVESSKQMIGLPMLAGESTEVFLRVGEDLFVNDDDPMAAMMGNVGPGRISVADATTLAEETTMPATGLAMLDPNPLYRDPLALLKALVYASNVPVVSTEDGLVVLEGPAPTGLSMGSMEAPGATGGPTMTVVLEAISGRPRSLTVGDTENPDFHMSFGEYEDLEEFDEKLFVLATEEEPRDLAEEIRAFMAQMEAMHGVELEDEF